MIPNLTHSSHPPLGLLISLVVIIIYSYCNIATTFYIESTPTFAAGLFETGDGSIE